MVSFLCLILFVGFFGCSPSKKIDVSHQYQYIFPQESQYIALQLKFKYSASNSFEMLKKSWNSEQYEEYLKNTE